MRELILAYKMELVLTKEQILEMYLNQIYFGRGAYGVTAASQTYFGKELSKLTLAESALPRRASQVTQPLFAVQGLRSGQEAAGTCAQPNGRGRVHQCGRSGPGDCRKLNSAARQRAPRSVFR